jgi:CRP/FNR family transcriptional regulator, cyclic AMP receptor protein
MCPAVGPAPVEVRRFSKKAESEKRAIHVPLFLVSSGLGRKMRKVRADEIVFAQGDPAKYILYIQEGGVQLTVLNGAGKEVVTAILEPGDFLGEQCLAGQPACMATATAITPTTVRVIGKEEMIRALHAEHEVSDGFIAYMVARSTRVEADLIDQLFNCSEKRLARTLLLLSRFGENRPPHKVLPKVSQAMLAEMIGTTRPRVNFFMNKFRKLGHIDYDGEIRIKDSLQSVVLHDE